MAKREQPERKAQRALFETGGDPDQMLLFNDGVESPDRLPEVNEESRYSAVTEEVPGAMVSQGCRHYE